MDVKQLYITLMVLVVFSMGCAQSTVVTTPSPSETPRPEKQEPALPIEESEKEVPIEEPTTPEVEEEQDFETVEVAEQTQTTHIPVVLNNRGFDPDRLSLTVGESITITIDEDLDYNKVMFSGVRNCGERMRSALLERGDSFNWTFTEIGRCNVVESVSASKVLKVDID